MEILDTTIRDGSYAVDFKFSCRDVQDLVSRSQKIGIKYIEICHGMGLNASSLEHGLSLNNDDEYIGAAKEVSRDAKLGCFCIPGIADCEHVKNAKQCGIDFVRIGININEIDQAYKYVSFSKSLGLYTFVNLMKSYTDTPKGFALKARKLAELGADCVYLVDSAGCMLPCDLQDYIQETRERADVKLGFHGHNNLGMAIANTVFCVEMGMDFVDCTFQGIGRSAGNASLEQLIMVLARRGYELGFDIPMVLEFGYAGLRRIMTKDLINPLDFMCGYVGFHSSHLKMIYKCSNEKKVDPLRLIMAYSEYDRVGMDYQKMCEIADTLPRDFEENPYSFAEYYGERYR